MSVFLTPDLKPIVGGTYFPPEDTPRQTGFKTLLLNVAHKVQNRSRIKYHLKNYRYSVTIKTIHIIYK